jgi:hypothetical protein
MYKGGILNSDSSVYLNKESLFKEPAILQGKLLDIKEQLYPLIDS